MCAVGVNGKLTEWFYTLAGVIEGHVLSTLLFNRYFRFYG